MRLGDVAISLAEIVAARPIPLPPRPAAIGVADEEIASTGRHGHAEGQTFMIEYVDASGASSRRRITVHDVSLTSGGIPCLSAFCHERKAHRNFRVDRIACCIDFDGEVHDDVPAFMSQNFGITIDEDTIVDPEDEARAKRILAMVSADSVLLAAMIRADQRLKSIEIETAADYLARTVERSGMMLTDYEIQRLTRRLERQRPTLDNISRAIDALAAFGPQRVTRTLLAAADVMACDGQRHPRELALLDALAKELLGTTIFQP